MADPVYVPLYGMIDTEILCGEETKDENGSYIVSTWNSASLRALNPDM